jgi:hypothetical protein
MHGFYPTPRTTQRLLALALSALAYACAHADTAAQTQERQRLYQEERQVCQSGASNQSSADCLREAAAAQQPGGNTAAPSSAASLQANARQRCEALPAGDQQSCLLRMQGAGSVSGSVEAGGLLRELHEPAP